MNKYEALLRSLRNRREIVEKLIDVEGTKMDCYATTLIKFTSEDEELVKQLEPENPKAYCVWKPFEKTDLARIQHEIDDIRPDRPLSTNLGQLQESSLPGKGITFQVDGETFNIHASNLQKYAFAVRCRLDFLMRVKRSTAQVFVDKEKELALKKQEKGILSCFYNEVYKGHFRLSQEGWLMMYMDNMEFKQVLQESGQRTFCFHCTAGGCNAVIHLAYFGDQMCIRYINHSNLLAHGHGNIPARESIADICYDISSKPQMVGHSPIPKNFPNAEFSVDASQCDYSGSTVMIRQPETNYTFRSTHPPNVHGVTTFFCTSNFICKCDVQAYGKIIKGQHKIKFTSKQHNHAHPLSEPQNRSRLNADQLADDEFTMDLVRVPKKKNRKNTIQDIVNYLLKHGEHEYNFHGRDLNAKNTTWWCSLGSKCKAKIVKREINGEPKGYLYTDDHTCIDEQPEEGASASGVQMDAEE